MPDFLDISRVTAPELRGILTLASEMKSRRAGLYHGVPDHDRPMDGRIAALIFEKPSTRTRVSFDLGVRQLGGQSMLLSGGEIHLGQGENIFDTSKVISRFADIAMIRTFEAEALLEFSEAATIPVINGLTNSTHPCQVLADVMTFEEHRGPIAGKRIAWIGTGTNVCHSFIEASVAFEFDLIFAGPDGCEPRPDYLKHAESKGRPTRIVRDPRKAVSQADLVVTDAWISMHEDEQAYANSLSRMRDFQVNAELMANAKSETLFMHCLPAHRGEEVTSEVMDGPNSVVFDEAENRLHAQKAILRWCLNA